MKRYIFFLALVSLFSRLSGQTFREFPSGSGADLFAPVIADFNGDSLPDVIGNDYRIFGGGLGINLLLNNTTDSLTFREEGYIGDFIPAGGIPGAGDFDQDGDVDFIAAQDGDGDLYLFQNDGDANFTVVSMGISGATVLKAGDFNGDGNIDFAGYASDDARGIFVYLNDGANNYSGNHYFPEFNSITDLEVFDWNNDGRDDIAINRESLDFDKNSTLIFLSNERGVPEEGPGIQFDLADRGLFADINNDGLIDIIVAERNALYPYLADGNDGFTSIGFIQFGFRELRTIKIADFDGDNRNDVLIGSREDGMQYYRRTESDDAYEFEQNNVGEQITQPISIAVADMDNDGDLDFVASGTVAYWYENIISSVPPVSVATYEQLIRPAFPNPATNMLNLPGLETLNAKADIYSVDGRYVGAFSLVGGSLSVAKLPAGIYQLLTDTGDGIIAVRFVKIDLAH